MNLLEVIVKLNDGTSEKRYVNIDYIINIEPSKNKGTKITFQGAMTNTYWDIRSIEIIKMLIDELQLIINIQC